MKTVARRVWLGTTIALLLCACDPVASTRLEGLADRADLPPAHMTGVVFEGYAEGTRDLVITAARAQVDSAAGVAHLEQVRISFAGEERGPTRITAPSAEFKLDEDDFLLTGGVRGSTQDGESFTTPSVRYDHETRTLRSTESVRVDRSNLHLRAQGMELDVATRALKLTGKVRAELSGGAEG